MFGMCAEARCPSRQPGPAGQTFSLHPIHNPHPRPAVPLAPPHTLMQVPTPAVVDEDAESQDLVLTQDQFGFRKLILAYSGSSLYAIHTLEGRIAWKRFVKYDALSLLLKSKRQGTDAGAYLKYGPAPPPAARSPPAQLLGPYLAPSLPPSVRLLHDMRSQGAHQVARMRVVRILGRGPKRATRGEREDCWQGTWGAGAAQGQRNRPSTTQTLHK